MRAVAFMAPVEAADLPEYPLTRRDRLDSHYFITWQHRRWLTSEMRLKGAPEARALYFDLICLSQDQNPTGTLPRDMEQLAKLLMVDQAHFARLCAQDFGPLHRWTPCLCDDEVRLYHPHVLETVLDAISRRHQNIARTDAANVRKRQERLRKAVAGLHAEMSKNDAAIRWMDDWLVDQGVGYRSAAIIESAMGAWVRHVQDLKGERRNR